MSTLTSDPSRQEAAELWRQALARSGWFKTCAVEEINVAEAMGRMTAQPVMAVRPVPHYAGSAMDGYAVRSQDTKGAAIQSPIVLLRVPRGESLREGTAVLVDTGDALPTGADSVIMQEHVAVQDGAIEICAAILPGRHVRQIGEDIAAGAMVLPAGRILGPADIAAALAAGDDRIQVMARPRVTVIPTGDEIVDSAEDLAPGMIRDINSHMLSAMFSSWGATVRRHPIVPDDRDLLREAISLSLARSDLVVTIAGTSGGTEDFTREVMGSLGQICCHGVAIRPGRPVLLAVVEGKPVIGLPGYPVSCMLTAELFLRGMIYEYQRREAPEQQRIQARLDQETRSKWGVEEFVRVVLTPGTPHAVASVPARGASLISTLTQAHGWLRIAPTIEKIDAGEIVEVILF
jgi:putative molybdopterin biosynthesis protein